MSIGPLVTVIIPCYNRASFIDESIQSVLFQSYKNIELLVVDDGSTDNSRKIIEKYYDRLTILEHDNCENRGQSSSINLALSKSKGEYVAILDSDDLFKEKKIEKQLKFLEKNKNIDLVYSNGFVINEDGKILYKFYEPGHTEESKPENILKDCYFLLPNNSLVRKSVFKKLGGFDESLRSGQDHDMAIRIVENSKIAYIDDLLFSYRKHNNTISYNDYKLRWTNGFIILNKAAKRYSYPRKVIIKRLAVLNFRLGQCHVKDKELLIAAMFFLKAGLLDPMRSLKVLFGKEKISSPH